MASSKRLSGKRILVVEDSRDAQLLLSTFLSTAGAMVDLADDGKQGVDKASRDHYDIVLMDVQMPVMDGLQAVQQLRSLDYNKPVVALTANALKEQQENCLRAGFTTCITKPVNRDDLVSKLTNIIGCPSV